MAVTGKHALVQLGSIYFTRDGLVTGVHCKTEITGLDARALTSNVQVIRALSGKPYLQVSAQQNGLPIGIKFQQMEETVYDSIVAAIQAAITGLTTLALTITDTPYGSFTLTVVPDANPVRHAHEFQNTSLKNASFHFLTTS